MAFVDFKFVRFFIIDLVAVEIYKKATGQYKTVCTLLDCEDVGETQYYANFEELYYVFSDYLNNVELEFEPCVIMLKHYYGRN